MEIMGRDLFHDGSQGLGGLAWEDREGGSLAMVVAGCGFQGLTAGIVKRRVEHVAEVEVGLRPQHFRV
jgi:hypothetical protein